MIGGNLTAKIQVKENGKKNSIGAYETTWVDCTVLKGYLDLQGGDSKHNIFNAKVQQSTHIFLCDFTSFSNLKTGWVWDPFSFITGVVNKGQGVVVDVTSENARMVINGKIYEILLIDNPMNMNEHLEIYLRFVGGGNHGN